MPRGLLVVVLVLAVSSTAGGAGTRVRLYWGEKLTTMLDQDLGVLDVAALMRRAANGDHWAWERLVDQYARLIWSITVEFKLVESDAADVAQTTWLRLLEHIDRIEYPDRVGSWLAATARNECLRCLAARKRVVLGHDDVELDRRYGRTGRRSTSAFSPTSAHRWFATRCPACPGGGSGCWRCSWPTRRCLTPTYPMSSGCRSAASAPRGGAA